MKSIGVIYANSDHEGLRYIKEAEQSAASFKRFIPEAEYVLYTQANDYSSDVFDDIRKTCFGFPEGLSATRHKNGQMVAKLRALAESGYDVTLYLDSDTYALNENVRALIGLMDEFDIAVAHAPHRINERLGQAPKDVPTSFPEFNCGLVLFRNTPQVTRFMQDWSDSYVNHRVIHAHDQGAFRKLIYKTDLRIATLPPEYNYRGFDYNEAAVIVHNRESLPLYLQETAGTRFIHHVKLANLLLKALRSKFRLKEVYWANL